eukprot:m.340629 g.340629  ORF g.340629 m.340629 type:complete len:330 (+) comp19428_c0_seq1:190-1179(+)
MDITSFVSEHPLFASAVAVSVLSAGLLYITSKRNNTDNLKIDSLWIYPIKGCRGFKVDKMVFDRIGPVGDRRYMVVDEENNFVSQRERCKMALVCPSFDDDGSLILESSQLGMDRLKVVVNKPKTVDVSIWNTIVKAQLVSPEADKWFSKALGQNVRLVTCFPPDKHKRIISPKHYTPTKEHNADVVFADGFPALLVSRESINDIDAKASVSVDERNFRPNIIVKGAVAWDEDTWLNVSIGALDFKNAKPCSRCQVPTIDPENGTFNKRFEPIKSLKKYRALRDVVYVGNNLVHLKNGTIQVGDQVQVHAFKSPIMGWRSQLLSALRLQ